MIHAAVLDMTPVSLQNNFRDQRIIVSNIIETEIFSLDFKKKKTFIPPIYRSVQLEALFKVLVEKNSQGRSLGVEKLSVMLRSQYGSTTISLWDMKKQQAVVSASLPNMQVSQALSVLSACGMEEVERYRCTTILYLIEHLQTACAICIWKNRTTFLYVNSYSEELLVEALALVGISMDRVKFYTYQEVCALYGLPAV